MESIKEAMSRVVLISVNGEKRRIGDLQSFLDKEVENNRYSSGNANWQIVLFDLTEEEEVKKMEREIQKRWGRYFCMKKNSPRGKRIGFISLGVPAGYNKFNQLVKNHPVIL